MLATLLCRDIICLVSDLWPCWRSGKISSEAKVWNSDSGLIEQDMLHPASHLDAKSEFRDEDFGRGGN
ncbi:hypothetical protein Bca101_067917 [Brassica carinata]